MHQHTQSATKKIAKKTAKRLISMLLDSTSEQKQKRLEIIKRRN